MRGEIAHVGGEPARVHRAQRAARHIELLGEHREREAGGLGEGDVPARRERMALPDSEADGMRGDAAVAELRQALLVGVHDGDVRFLIAHEARRLDAVGLDDVEHDLRMGGLEHAQEARHEERRLLLRDGDAHPLVAVRHVLHLAFDRVDLREQAGELLREALPVLAHHDMASRAQEEIEPRLFLERLHRLAQRRLRDMQFRRGVRDVLQAADREEIAHLENCHAGSSFLVSLASIVARCFREIHRFFR